MFDKALNTPLKSSLPALLAHRLCWLSFLDYLEIWKYKQNLIYQS